MLADRCVTRSPKGRRAYVICPLVEGSERVEATSAVDERTRLATR